MRTAIKNNTPGSYEENWGGGGQRKKSIAFRKVDFYNLTDVVTEVSRDECLKEEKGIRSCNL